MEKLNEVHWIAHVFAVKFWNKSSALLYYKNEMFAFYKLETLQQIYEDQIYFLTHNEFILHTLFGHD